MPMLSRMPRDFRRGNFAADGVRRSGSTSWTVSSMRVPVRARTCSMNCPASTLGKKSWPSIASPAATKPTQNAEEKQRERTRVLEDTSPAARDNLRGNGRSRFQSARWNRTNGRTNAGASWLSSLVFAVAVQFDVAVKPHHQRRHERPRNDIAGEHREHHRLPPAARTDNAPRRSERTSARTRCRCTAWRRRPARRFPARRRGWRLRAALPEAM